MTHNEMPKDTVEEMEVELYTDLKGYNFSDAEIHLILEKVRKQRTTAFKKGVEVGRVEIEDTFICNRVGVHTCRANAVHIPFRFCGKIKNLLTPLPEVSL